jgi:hypothetical protein
MNCYAKCASNASLFFSNPRALSSPVRVTSGAGGVALASGALNRPFLDRPTWSCMYLSYIFGAIFMAIFFFHRCNLGTVSPRTAGKSSKQ